MVSFIVGCVSALVVSAVVADALTPRRDPWLRALGVVAGFPIVILVTVMTLGITGLLRADVAAGLLAAEAVAAVVWRIRFSKPAPQPAAPQPAGMVSTREILRTQIAVAILAGLAAASVAARIQRGTLSGGDDLRYHGPAMAHWTVDGRLTLKPYCYQAYYPLNAEAIATWFVLPFHHDGMVWLVGCLWLAVAATAVAALLHRLGASAAMALLGAAVVLATQEIVLCSECFAAQDLAGPAMLLAALAWALGDSCCSARDRLAAQHERASRTEVTWGQALFAGACAGVAVGTKALLAPAAAMVLLWLALRGGRQRGMRSRMRVCAGFLAGAALLGGYWYLRNTVLTGNPFFPASIGPFDGPLTAEAQGRTKLITWLTRSPVDWGVWRTMVKDYTDWGRVPFLMSMLGYALGIGGGLRALFRPSTGSGRPEALEGRRPGGTSTPGALFLPALGLVLLALHPFVPFSGTIDVPVGPVVGVRRYIILSFLIGLVLLFRALGSRKTLGGAAFAAVIVCLAVTIRFDQWDAWKLELVAVLGAALAMAAWPWAARRVVRWSAARRRATALGLAAGVLVALAAAEGHFHRLSSESLLRTQVRHPARDAWRALESLPSGSRVASFGDWLGRYYALFGRRLQLVPCVVTEAGKPLAPLHVRWQRDPDAVTWWGLERPDLTALVTNLRSAGVRYVVVSDAFAGHWPAQDAVLAASDEVELLFQAEHCRIWELSRSGG